MSTIGSIIAFIIVFVIPYFMGKKEDSRKSNEMYNRLNKQSHDEMEKWMR